MPPRVTATSIERQLPGTRRSVFLIAQWLLAIAIVWYAIAALRGQWAHAAERLQAIRPEWGWIALATSIVLATYLMLIETWRRIVLSTGQKLAFPEAARIWFVSNLGKYVPGK